MKTHQESDLEMLRRGDLAGARRLRLPGLTEVPPEVFGLADTLELLDLGGGALTSLPPEMGRLHKLCILFCSGNRFRVLPPALGDCQSLSQISFRACGLREIPGEALPPNLRWLILTENSIERLPTALGERRLLQKMMLAGNRLRELPASLADATSLELVRLSCNRFEAFPRWLARLPKLAWISWSGNPLERNLAPMTAVASAHWADIDLGERLGGGASGDVYRAGWRRPADNAEPVPVALKVFRGAMTSDGLPEAEIATCLAAGQHTNFSAALGRLSEHPECKEGLLMRLLPAAWHPLAAPPSFATCSRDVYSAELRLSPAAAMRVAGGIASAATHLHARGILHGDVYAHNVLWDGGEGGAALSDFGAASVLPLAGEGRLWQRTEVRAWGLLLDELLDRCSPAPTGLNELRELVRACVQPDVTRRPLMADVMQSLGDVTLRG
jgi:Protein tyrosine and serine/threonine kinase